MDKRTEKRVKLRIGSEEKEEVFHEATITAEEDMLEEKDFVPLEDDPDMEIILRDEDTKD